MDKQPYRTPSPVSTEEPSLPEQIISNLRAYARSAVRYDPNPYQHEPYAWMYKDREEIDAFADKAAVYLDSVELRQRALDSLSVRVDALIAAAIDLANQVDDHDNPKLARLRAALAELHKP